MNDVTLNVDLGEVSKFDKLASRWWDPNGEFKSLHEINPLRLAYIQKHVALEHSKVLDIGCGGGILSEAMANAGAEVTGIDMSDAPLSVAKLHLIESGLDIAYHKTTAEQQAEAQPEHYDVITCMEMLEHVPDPDSVIQACSQLVKPGGFIFFSTLNRNLKSYLFAIIGAEYVLHLLPKGTHNHDKFIKPSELLKSTRDAALTLVDLSGMSYQPFSKTYSLSHDVSVNYFVCLHKEV